jgi:hypothetical protein
MGIVRILVIIHVKRLFAMDEVEGEGVKRGPEPEGSEAWRPMRELGSFMPWRRLCFLVSR